MNESTETLVMFAQLLEAKPAILGENARQSAESLAADLNNLPEQDLEQAAAKIRNWMTQFPQEINILKKALQGQRKEVDEPVETSPKPIIPNFQIIEQPDGNSLITPAPASESCQPISPLLYVRQTLSRWIRKPS
ncbi:hypothetical protein PMG71_15110 [Roseofilum sp. BLCC_M154]|uniref:Uncharacterized protein n=1 Tax=Roseofilum acuticapitatum BLCC-M154 TaxID=3022444 RepID=A0ABT7AV14_9CYAN|nr:hypothetical protein [Roseofilum acuticapitatum]MDJ1170760.1 hypothetical protein [Roseofilum acuticapitatum BLCC-M154]